MVYLFGVVKVADRSANRFSPRQQVSDDVATDESARPSHEYNLSHAPSATGHGGITLPLPAHTDSPHTGLLTPASDYTHLRD